MSHISKKKQAFLLLAPLTLLFLSLFLGRYTISPITGCKAICAKFFPLTPSWSDKVETVLFR